MNLIALTIPDEQDQWPGWIEDRIVRGEVVETVAQLRILQNQPGEFIDLETTCGHELSAIRKTGLSSVDPEISRRLIASPESMLALEDDILINGEAYWMERLGKPASISTERIQQLSSTITGTATPVTSHRPVAAKSQFANVVAYVGSLALLAFLAIGVWQLWPDSPTKGWGFNASGLLTADISAEEFQVQLADAALAWFNKQPDNENALRKRILEFDAGCQTLIKAELLQLDAGTRENIRVACRTCRDDLAKHLAALNDPQTEFTDLRDAVDATIRDLESSIRDA